MSNVGTREHFDVVVVDARYAYRRETSEAGSARALVAFFLIQTSLTTYKALIE